jgi:prepilin-type N-terminal cleavage/methylation domain-containing protein
MNARLKNEGFSLIELSITLVIVGLLIGSMISGFTIYQENSLIRQAQQDLKLIHEALVGYAIQNRRLPCPDDDGPGAPTFGQEDQAPCNAVGAGNVVVGFLPFQDLGIAGVVQDPWGNPYAYAVDAGFADIGVAAATACAGATPNITFGACDLGTLRVYDTGNTAPGTCNAPCVAYTETTVAVFYSFGANGYSLPAANYSLHEQSNIWSVGVTGAPVGAVTGSGNDPQDRVFVSRNYARSGATQFDDQLMWLPATILVSQMVKAGQLP